MKNKDSVSLLFMGDINESNVKSFIENFMILDSKPNDITLYICSGGGETDLGITMHDVIKSSMNRVVAVGCGIVGSAAVLPFAAADVRLVQPNCDLFFHENSVGIMGEAMFSKTRMNSMNETMHRKYERYCEMVGVSMGVPVATIKNLCSKDHYLDYNEASQLGLIHGVYGFNKSKKATNTDLDKALSVKKKNAKNIKLPKNK